MVEKKVIRAKAPLRLGIAGEGTDTSPYSDEFGGMALNATITMYAYAAMIPRHDGRIRLISDNYNECIEISAREFLNLDGKFDLPLCEYDISRLAHEVEKKDLGIAGGKQDQYAATFVGFNFMEFLKGDNVIVNPLRIKQDYINDLEFNLLLYHTGTSRLSFKIIESQSKNIAAKKAGASGDGGLMLLNCPGTSRYSVIEAIKDFGGEFQRYQFTKYGLTTWSIRE